MAQPRWPGVVCAVGAERAVWGIAGWRNGFDRGTDIALGLESTALIS